MRMHVHVHAHARTIAIASLSGSDHELRERRQQPYACSQQLLQLTLGRAAVALALLAVDRALPQKVAAVELEFEAVGINLGTWPRTCLRAWLRTTLRVWLRTWLRVWLQTRPRAATRTADVAAATDVAVGVLQAWMRTCCLCACICGCGRGQGRCHGCGGWVGLAHGRGRGLGCVLPLHPAAAGSHEARTAAANVPRVTERWGGVGPGVAARRTGAAAAVCCPQGGTGTGGI